MSQPGLYTEDWTARKEPQAWTKTPDDPISAVSVGKYKSVLSIRQLNALYGIRLSKRVKTPSHLPRSFGALLDFLQYEPLTSKTDQGIGTGTRFILEGGDYWRRSKRFLRRRQFPLPRVYTRLS